MFKLLITLLLLHRGSGLSCYDCTSEPTDDDYDENCMNDNYDGGVITTSTSRSCYTEVYDNGAVVRYSESYEHPDGECQWRVDNVNYWRCFCSSEKCNNGLCQHCYQSTSAHSTTLTTEPTTEPTTVTTEPTTVTTTVTTEPTTVTTTGTTEPTTVTSTTTTEPTTVTTTVTTEPSTESTPSIGLNCYSCVDCPVVDIDTPHVFDPLFQSCVSVLMGPQSTVLRAGDYEMRQDGECVSEDGGIFCYCVGNLCNDGQPTTVTTTNTAYTTSSIGLQCYSCIDCPVVDIDTPAVVDPLFQSCVTVVMGSEWTIMRAGDYDMHQDGICINEDGGKFCYCLGDLCNN